MECQAAVAVLTVPVMLAFIGALISLADMLWSGKSYTQRQWIGGPILGSATCAIAGGIFHFVPNIGLPAVIALGCGFGLMGHVYIRRKLIDQTDKFTGDKDDRS